MQSATVSLARSAAAPDRVEWYFNNLRVMQSTSVKWDALMPQGTTSNEALHAEMNGWFTSASDSLCL